MGISLFKENPYSAHVPEEELSGYHSLSMSEFQVVIQIYSVDHRKGGYGVCRESMEGNSGCLYLLFAIKSRYRDSMSCISRSSENRSSTYDRACVRILFLF
jgi:hypothetical protein